MDAEHDGEAALRVSANTAAGGARGVPAAGRGAANDPGAGGVSAGAGQAIVLLQTDFTIASSCAKRPTKPSRILASLSRSAATRSTSCRRARTSARSSSISLCPGSEVGLSSCSVTTLGVALSEQHDCAANEVGTIGDTGGWANDWFAGSEGGAESCGGQVTSQDGNGGDGSADGSSADTPVAPSTSQWWGACAESDSLSGTSRQSGGDNGRLACGADDSVDATPDTWLSTAAGDNRRATGSTELRAASASATSPPRSADPSINLGTTRLAMPGWDKSPRVNQAIIGLWGACRIPSKSNFKSAKPVSCQGFRRGRAANRCRTPTNPSRASQPSW
mmetsp:Transcript_90694/g.252251  ORF Transcript_90694/g.252251 Transcript_90694/m.252251 type:complete len:334 (-) Transcript_90694:2537-3538(-)